MKNGKRVHGYRGCLLHALIFAGIIYEISLPSLAGSSQLRDANANITMTSYETRRSEQLQEMSDARIGFKTAMIAGAEKAAPYEYYLAQEFLNLAEEKFRSGDIIGVGRFAVESHKYSSAALKKAEGGLQ